MSADLPWPVLLLGAAALFVWVSPRDAVSRRARALRRPGDPRPASFPSALGAGPPAALSAGPPSARGGGRPSALGPGTPGITPGRRWLLAGSAGVAVGVLVGGVPGAGLAMAVAVGAERLLRARATDDRQETRGALARDLPAACDLLGVCLAAGVPVAGALAAVGEAMTSPLGPQLCGVAALYRMGADPRRAWADVPSELAGLGRVMVRAGESGSTVAPALRALAADGRSAGRAATEAAVRRAGVWVLAPLGLCFLPAFVCLGVVPLILGIAGDVFG